MSLSYLPPLSMRVNSYRKEFAPRSNFFSLRYDSISERLPYTEKLTESRKKNSL